MRSPLKDKFLQRAFFVWGDTNTLFKLLLSGKQLFILILLCCSVFIAIFTKEAYYILCGLNHIVSFTGLQ